MGEAAFGAMFTIAIIAFSIAGSSAVIKFMQSTNECNKNDDCGQTSYCGSDFKCHEFPHTSTTIVQATNWVTPAAILALSIVMGALILRRRFY